MTNYIEFRIPKSYEHVAYSCGMPFFYGNVPEVSTDSPVIRLDGEPVDFVNENLPSLLLRALHDMKNAYSDSEVNCRRFAALMHEPAIAETLPRSFLRPDYSAPVDSNDLGVERPVLLGTFGDASPLEEDDFYGRHMAFPAHLPNQPSYLHKLGYGGPICLSGLQKAMDVYKCTHAFQPIGFATGELK